MKLTIQELKEYPFITKYQVNIADINYGGHVGNDRFLSIAHEARIQFYSFLEISEKNIGDGIGTIMANAIVNYKNEAFHKDELSIEIGIGEVGRSSFEVLYRLSNQNNMLVATILTTIIAFDYDKRKVRSLPSSFLESIKKATQ